MSGDNGTTQGQTPVSNTSNSYFHLLNHVTGAGFDSPGLVR